MTSTTARIGEPIVRLEEAASTNTSILEREDWLNAHGLVVIARHQTAGRGRLGRRWASLPGAQLQFSVVVHPRGDPEEAAVVALVAGLAVAQGIEAAVDLAPRLKWPNDVQLGGRKVCGILIESKPGAAGRPRLVVGIGINVNGSAEDFPPELRAKITTLAEQAGRTVESEPVLMAVLDRLDALTGRLDSGERAAILNEWRARADVTGRPVRFAMNRALSDGRAAGIDDNGHLLIDLPGGSRHAHASGEVEWLDV